MEKARKQFGRNVKARRLALGLTQESLAAAAETSRTYVAQLENGEYNATLETICKLAWALKCEAAELLANIPVERPIEN